MDNLDLQTKRRRTGLSQDAVAEHYGVNSSYISQFEKGHRTYIKPGVERPQYEAYLDDQLEAQDGVPTERPEVSA